MIRSATPDDLPALLRLGEVMHRNSTYAHLSYSPERLARTLVRLLEADGGAVFVCEIDGVVAGALPCELVPAYFSDALIAQDLAIFVDPEARALGIGLALVRRFIEWAGAQGAARVEVKNGAGMDDRRFVRLMARMGFTLAGSAMYLEV